MYCGLRVEAIYIHFVAEFCCSDTKVFPNSVAFYSPLKTGRHFISLCSILEPTWVACPIQYYLS
jgi:hypothetical protein